MGQGLTLSYLMAILLGHACLIHGDIVEHIHDYTCTYNGLTYGDGQVVPVERLLISRQPCWTCRCRGGVMTVCTNERCQV